MGNTFITVICIKVSVFSFPIIFLIQKKLIIYKITWDRIIKSWFSPTLHHAEPVKGANRTLIDKEKGIYEFNKLAILRTATMPALLFECGIIKNRDEEKSINTDYRNKLVNAIVSAVIRYYDDLNNKSR